MAVPEREEGESLNQWVSRTAEALDISTGEVWSIIEVVKPQAKILDHSDSSELLIQLLEQHRKYNEYHLATHGKPDQNAWIELTVDGEVIYQISDRSHNVPGLNEAEVERVKTILENEGMEILSIGDQYVAAHTPQNDPLHDINIIQQVMSKLWDSDIDEIEHAIDVSANPPIQWTEADRLKSRLNQYSEKLREVEKQNEGREKRDATTKEVDSTSSTTKKEYHSWIFCQSCGERINDPNENPRFCGNCRD